MLGILIGIVCAIIIGAVLTYIVVLGIIAIVGVFKVGKIAIAGPTSAPAAMAEKRKMGAPPLLKPVHALKLSHPEAPASQRQMEYAEHLGIKLPDGCDMGTASLLISQRLDDPNSSITERQRMLLNFLGQVPDANWGKKEVMEWLDSNLTNEMRDKWELFKSENPEIADSNDPTLVPLGAIEQV